MGAEQAGHIRRIGTGLYRHLLDRALMRARGTLVPEEWTPELALGVHAFLPTDYVPQPQVRLEIYERLAKLASAEMIDDLAEELADRFGEPPQAAANLLELARLRLICRALGLARLEVGPKGAASTVRNGIEPKTTPAGASGRGNRLVLHQRSTSDTERFAAASELLRVLTQTNLTEATTG
jgi:transcription-repair coupling factor (superfamily II helicase)